MSEHETDVLFFSSEPMTRQLPFVFSQSVAREGPYLAWYILHNPHFCETHFHNLVRGNWQSKMLFHQIYFYF